MTADTAAITDAATTVTAPAQHTRFTPGVLLVLGSCISLQFGSAFATMLFPQLGSWGTTGLRIGIAAVALLVIARPRVRQWSKQQWCAVAVFGLALAGMNGFFYAAIARIPLGPAVCIEFLGPLTLAAVLSRRWREAIWIAAALLGISLFFIDDLAGAAALDLLGVGFVLLAACCWAGYILTSERAGRLVPGLGGLAVALGIAALLLLPFTISAVPALVAEPRLALLAIGTAALGSLVPYSLELSALRRLPKPVFGVLLSLEPVVASLAGWMLLRQNMTPLGMWAIALVVTASAGSTLSARRRARRSAAPV